MGERLIALEAIATVGCYYFDTCPIKNDCGRINLDADAGQIPVNQNATDLTQAHADLRQLHKNWSNIKEPVCTRPDNILGGEPIEVIRSSVYFVHRVTESEL